MQICVVNSSNGDDFYHIISVIDYLQITGHKISILWLTSFGEQFWILINSQEYLKAVVYYTLFLESKWSGVF